MRLRSFAYAMALAGQWAALVAAIMLGRRLLELGAERARLLDTVRDLTSGAGAPWLWSGLVAAGLWAGAWWLAERGIRPDARGLAGRKALLYLGQMAALAGLILQIVLLVIALLTRPQPADMALRVVELALGALIALAFWAFLRWIAVGDGDFGREMAGAGWRRFYYYGSAWLALGLFLFGLVELLQIIAGVGLRIIGASSEPIGDRARFVRAAACALVAAPAWWALWWQQQARSRGADLLAAEERRARLRRLYLYAVILISAVAFFFGLGMSLLGLVAGRRWTLVATWAPVGLVGGICLIGHLVTLHRDEQGAPHSAEAARAPVPPAPVSPAPPAAGSGLQSPAAAPRRYTRAALPPTPVAPRPPAILIVDGLDGAVGARLIAGLAARLPDAVLWPLGLNAAAQMALLTALGGAPPVVPADAPARAALIMGPSDMLIADGLDGEVGAELAAALAHSPAHKLLLPPRDPRLRWIAAPDWPIERWIENAVIEASNALATNR
ncbi:MAG: DUF3842 family protein [Anaerolineae bacterium]|nr:DUF3842 family protein [Anaerolineae bacterium]